MPQIQTSIVGYIYVGIYLCWDISMLGSACFTLACVASDLNIFEGEVNVLRNGYFSGFYSVSWMASQGFVECIPTPLCSLAACSGGGPGRSSLPLTPSPLLQSLFT